MILAIVEVVKSLKNVMDKNKLQTLLECKVFLEIKYIFMYCLTINQFKKEIENKNRLEAIEYAIANLANAEDILLNAKACKDTDSLQEYINFLK